MYYNILVHVIKDAERSHDLPCASWRLRRAGGVVQRLESQGANGVDSSLSLKACEPGVLRAGED